MQGRNCTAETCPFKMHIFGDNLQFQKPGDDLRDQRPTGSGGRAVVGAVIPPMEGILGGGVWLQQTRDEGAEYISHTANILGQIKTYAP